MSIKNHLKTTLQPMHCYCAILLLLAAISFCQADSKSTPPPIKNGDTKTVKTPYGSTVTAADALIYQVTLKGAITPSVKEALNLAIEQAENDNAKALLVQLDTPGGLMSSMDDMIRRILNARLPIITYVGPPGAACGSAGVYLMYASHIAAMAPATNIGSATPITMGGGGGGESKDGDPSDHIPKIAGANDHLNMKRKLMNHARAQIRSLAQYHGRNVRFAEDTVTKAVNLSSQEAYKRGAIDFLARDVSELLHKAEGRKIRMATGYVKLRLGKKTRIVALQKDTRQKILDLLANPNLVQIFMMLGVLGLLAEVKNPGLIFPGVIGAFHSCLVCMRCRCYRWTIPVWP